jgi:flavin-dependent dehydrogenase
MGIPLADHRSNMNNPPPIYDLAIAGGGLAGLSLAIQLSKKGYQILLFEKEIYPFHKVCGEYIGMESRGFLTELGLPLDEWNLPLIREVVISAANGRSIRETLTPGGFGISRYKLDAALAALAGKAGAVILENTRVNSIEYQKEFFNISSSSGLFRARTVCGSFGKRSNLDIKWKRSFINSSRKKNYVGIKYHVRAGFPGHEISLHNFSGGYCGISKIEDDRYCLCYLTLAENLKKCGQSISEMEEHILKKNPRLRELFGQVHILYDQPLTISQVSFAKKTQVENHVLFVGDAAGMITPLCGNGMSMALRGSKIAASCLEKFFSRTCSREEMERAYQHEWNRVFAKRLRAGHILQYFFGNPFLSGLLIGALKPFPALIRTLIRKTHGEPF